MQVAQRGTSFSLTGNGYGQYTLDRWAAYYNYTEVAQLNAVIDGQYKNYVKVSGNASNDPSNLFFYQKIESGSKLLSGKTFTLSFFAKSSNNTAIRIRGRFYDSAAETNSVASTISSSISLTSDWTKYTVTHTATDSSANMTRDFFLLFDNAGGSFSNGDDFWLTEVQLELGDTATPFEHRSFGQELALCQRYFEKTDREGTDTYRLSINKGTTSASYFFPIGFRVTKRAKPTTTLTQTFDDNLDLSVHTASTGRNHMGVISTQGSGGGTTDTRALAEFTWTADAEL
tara:strand:+ start:80 stop:940 length:861 start_codon:yes stop_codon:yes gene_type:complete